jgi:hypothetical protein
MSRFLGSSVVEHAAVNRRVVGSNPTRGALESPGHKCDLGFLRFGRYVSHCLAFTARFALF